MEGDSKHTVQSQIQQRQHFYQNKVLIIISMKIKWRIFIKINLHKVKRHKRRWAVKVFSSLSISIPSATPGEISLNYFRDKYLKSISEVNILTCWPISEVHNLTTWPILEVNILTFEIIFLSFQPLEVINILTFWPIPEFNILTFLPISKINILTFYATPVTVKTTPEVNIYFKQSPN